MNVFISHSGEEKELAVCLANWLQSVLTGVETFCSSRPGDIAADEWRRRIFSEATQNDILISLLSYDSFQKPWIHFEAGLATASARAPRIVPAIYGGLSKRHVPSTINQWHIIDLTNPHEFRRSLSTIFKGQIRRNRHPTLDLDSFLSICGQEIGRFIQYGPLGTWLKGDILPEVHDQPIELVPSSQEMELPIARGNRRMSAVRMVVRPLPVETTSQWKCGLEITRQGTKPGEREFAFHSGCHFNITSFTVYPGNRKNVFIAVPAELRLNEGHFIQMWFGPSFKEIQVVGIDSSQEYRRLTTDGNNPVWRPNIGTCDVVRLYAWADGAPFRVSIERLNIDYICVQ